MTTPIQYADDDYESGLDMVKDVLNRYYERQYKSAKPPDLGLDVEMRDGFDYQNRDHMKAFQNKVDKVLARYNAKTRTQRNFHHCLCVILVSISTVLCPTTGEERVRGLEGIADHLDVLVGKHDYDISSKNDQKLWKGVMEIVELLENGPEHVDAGQDVTTVSTARASYSSIWTRIRKSCRSRFSKPKSRPSSARYSNLTDETGENQNDGSASRPSSTRTLL